MLKENIEVESIKKYYIAYFDLLGYKKFFENNSDKVESFLKDIHGAILNAKSYLQKVGASSLTGGLGQISIQTKIFSDNILLCLETGTTSSEYSRFLAFMLIVADIQRNFILQYGLFLRGGITIGTLSFNKDFVFGQGLIDAVALEEKAVYPRIVIGKTVLDYDLPTHFVKIEDLKKASEIENRINVGEAVSDEEEKFHRAISPSIKLESFCLAWRNHLILKTLDGTSVLNYLYCVDINSMIDQKTKDQVYQYLKTNFLGDFQKIDHDIFNQKQLLVQHREHIVQKINEYGRYDNLDASADVEAGLQEHVLKKYLWVLSFHNYVCEIYNLPKYRIKSGSTCDIRFMRLTAEIIE